MVVVVMWLSDGGCCGNGVHVVVMWLSDGGNGVHVVHGDVAVVMVVVVW